MLVTEHLPHLCMSQVRLVGGVVQEDAPGEGVPGPEIEQLHQLSSQVRLVGAVV